MYNVKKKDELVNLFTATADSNLDLVKSYGSVSKSMQQDDADMVKYLIKKAEKAVSDSVPEGLDVPKVVVYVSQNGDENRISVIDLTLRNKPSSDYEFRFKKQLVYSENVDEVLADFLKCTYVELITDALIRENIEEINAKLAQIGKDAGNNFTVKIASPISGEGKKVVKITDDEIVLVADESRVLAMDDILVFCQPTEFLSQETIDKGYQDTVALFAQAQTTPQFLNVHEPLVSYICDISKMVKPMTIIKKVYPKNVQNLRSDKETMAYFSNKEVFSVVHVNEDGKAVVLKPFDVKTLEVVDFDVLAAL